MVSELEDVDSIIEDEDYLFRGVPPAQWDFENNRPGTFSFNTDELSVDWSQKRTCLDFMERERRKELGHGCVRFKARFPRQECSLTVRYAPEINNDAHSLVLGKKPKLFLKAIKRRDGNFEVVEHARTAPAAS